MQDFKESSGFVSLPNPGRLGTKSFLKRRSRATAETIKIATIMKIVTCARVFFEIILASINSPPFF